MPNSDTTCTPSHRFEFDEKMIEAQHIVNDNVVKIKVDESVKVYHVLLENNEWRWMIANGLLAETLDPKDIVSRFFNV